MLLNKIRNLFLVLLLISASSIITGCSDPVSSNTDTPVKPSQNTYPFKAPTNVSVTKSDSKANTVTVSWKAVDNEEITYYLIYCSTTNDTSSLTKPAAHAYAGLFVNNGIGSYDITLSESGTYYFWVKAANNYSDSDATKVSDFSSVKSFNFTYSGLTVPTNISASLSKKTANSVDITWDASDAGYYWLYYSTTNDTSSLSRPQANISGLHPYVNNGIGSYNFVLEETGTYYIWLKAADSYYNSTGKSSDFSRPETYSFTYTELTTPTEVNANKADTNGKVTVTWKASDAAYYWIYYSTTNDTSSLSRPQENAIAGLYVNNGLGSYNISLSESGTYYIWVKAANASYTSTGKSSGFSEPVTYVIN